MAAVLSRGTPRMVGVVRSPTQGVWGAVLDRRKLRALHPVTPSGSMGDPPGPFRRGQTTCQNGIGLTPKSELSRTET